MDRLLQANRSAADLDGEKAADAEENSERSLQDGLLLFQNKLVVPEEGDLRTRLLDMTHRQPSTAHPGRTMTETLHILMDFRSCPKDKHGFDETCVIVDRLTKRVISIPCHKNVSAVDMAQLFLEYTYRWVGLPESILSDRGGQFVSAFWEELCLRPRIKRRLTSGQKPSTNGHTEIVNHCCRIWTSPTPSSNTSQPGFPLFQVERGYEPRVSFDWASLSQPRDRPQDQAGACRTACRLEQIWDYARGQIELAQVKMKQQTNKHRRLMDFKAEGWVYVTTKDWELGRPSRKFGDQ
ncbi:integrase catalytic domain-containing protein [Aspergillus affinis]|uniref:integrase catalytic domain-containing protein n=1 Tax=Aspergillus affinis TaxID=1070780 RepID=UPI0022FE909D|nr:putative retrovirus polyprotein [Aspergillus affinis]KAI9035909.1 putative retrovirus polyprotein [Aspergillus affinis]